MATADEIYRFWSDEIDPPKGWFATNPTVDALIKERFGADLEPAAAGAYDAWLDAPQSALALIVLLDQFPRNIFRGAPQSFAYDEAGLRVTNIALRRGWDLEIEPPMRAFFYLPLEHSEQLGDQNRAVALTEARLGSGSAFSFHARAHRDVILQFGRFPHRNSILGRASTLEEQAFLSDGGYNPLK